MCFILACGVNFSQMEKAERLRRCVNENGIIAAIALDARGSLKTALDEVNGGDHSSFVWTFDGETKTGSSIDVKCKNPDKFYDIVVTEYDSTGAKMNTTSLSAMCKYVRREIRTLTDDDRTSYFDAMEIL